MSLAIDSRRDPTTSYFSIQKMFKLFQREKLYKIVTYCFCHEILPCLVKSLFAARGERDFRRRD